MNDYVLTNIVRQNFHLQVFAGLSEPGQEATYTLKSRDAVFVFECEGSVDCNAD